MIDSGGLGYKMDAKLDCDLTDRNTSASRVLSHSRRSGVPHNVDDDDGSYRRMRESNGKVQSPP